MRRAVATSAGENRALYYTKRFPYKGRDSCKPHEVVIGIGGNLGDVPRRFFWLVEHLKRDGRADVLSTSPLYLNPAFGYEAQPPFYNAIIKLGWRGGYVELFAYTSYLERCFGRPRKRAFKNAPRTLDIDIIFFGAQKIQMPSLTIPHRHWAERDSVIVPLILETYNH